MSRSLLWVLLALAACSEAHRNLVSDPVSSDSGARTKTRDASITAADSGNPTPHEAATAYCGKRACSCDDGIDNDDDGLSDGLDPECTGAFDDDEASFATGLPSKDMGCRDCYWDANNGSGDDGCRYPSECLTNAAFVGKGNCGSCSVSSECESSCKARTPNGCDCFGCCAASTASGTPTYIQLVDGCTLAKATNSAACPRCTPHPSCKNECGRCELCLGKRLSDLPSDCRTGTGPGYVCDDAVARCSAASPCPDGSYCHQGCCLVDLL